MADFNVQPIATQIRPVQPMSLADMVNLARGVQAYQQAQQMNPVELQTAQQQLSRLQQLTPEEVRRAQAEAQVAQQTVQPRISTAQSTATQAGAQASTAQLENLRSQISNMSRQSLNLLTKEDLTHKDIESFVEKTMRNTGATQEAINQAKADIPMGASPAGLRAWLARNSANALSAEAQLEKLFPSAQMLQTGAAAVPVTMGSPYLATQAPGTIAGPGVEMQIPPTQQIVTPTGETRLVGPLSQRGQQPQQFVTGLTPPQAGALQAASEVIKEDLPRTVAEAKDAPARIGIFQNIKKLTPDALTGPTAERRQMIASLAQMIGIDVYKMETASTDELLKNTSLLQLAGGNTDAARELAKFANPNNKMTKEGITRVTNQLLGIENMKLARANYLTPAQNDAAQYMQRKQAFDSISDPRLFQEMTEEDARKMWNAMSQSERDKIIAMRNQARAIGVIK